MVKTGGYGQQPMGCVPFSLCSLEVLPYQYGVHCLCQAHLDSLARASTQNTQLLLRRMVILTFLLASKRPDLVPSCILTRVVIVFGAGYLPFDQLNPSHFHLTSIICLVKPAILDAV